MSNGVMFFDFDGCISSCGWRESLLPQNKITKGYDKFHELLGLDPPNTWIIRLMNTAKVSGYKIVILTGRMEYCREASVKWLNDNFVLYDYMVMRSNDDFRHSEDYKSSILELYRKEDVKMVFDDMEKNINRFKELGYPTCLVKC